MLFVSQKFIGFFLAAFLVYWAIPGRQPWHRVRMLWLLAASAFFYMGSMPYLILLILFSASIDFAAALVIERSTDVRIRRGLLIGSIAINLGLLLYFKYVNFFLDNLFAFGNWLGLSGQHRVLDILLPLGISFYTFETISYIVDVYRGKVKAERDPLAYALFILFFPHLIAGPIVRPGDFLPQTRRLKRFSWNRLDVGARLFLLGFIKKAVIADHLAPIADRVFADPAAFDSLACFVAVLAWAGQVYGDFSGYSDMAIGLAHTFGFKLHANFDRPYMSANVSELWRRWHISLSSWLRDYLFIPLGGSRGGEWATNRNLFITMLVGGFWHGANWPFVLWGAFNGAALAAHRTLTRFTGPLPIPRPIAIALTFATFCAGLIIFRTKHIFDAGRMFANILSPLIGLPAAGTGLDGQLVVLGFVLFGAVMFEQWYAGVRPAKALAPRVPAAIAGAAMGACIVLALLFVPEDGKAFIYFQF